MPTYVFYFINNLVDYTERGGTFYDMRVNIVVSAEKEPEALYTADKLKFEFVRAVSRINEMQTDKYITSSKLTDDKKL